MGTHEKFPVEEKYIISFFSLSLGFFNFCKFSPKKSAFQVILSYLPVASTKQKIWRWYIKKNIIIKKKKKKNQGKYYFWF